MKTSSVIDIKPKDTINHEIDFTKLNEIPTEILLKRLDEIKGFTNQCLIKINQEKEKNK